MGRLLLISRLAVRDVRRRPAQAVLLLIAIMAATSTLTLGLALRGVTSGPYQQTRAATAGPDVVARAFPPAGGQPPASLTALAHAPGVTRTAGPYPVAWPVIRTGRLVAVAEAQGRDEAPARVDQPRVTQGGWVRPGGVVVERTFADALGLRIGGRITLNGRPFTVTGFAVSAAVPVYPNVCSVSCDFGYQAGLTNPATDTGLIWLVRAAAQSLATKDNPAAYQLDLTLVHPASAGTFAAAVDRRVTGTAGPYLYGWQSVAGQDGLLVADVRQVLVTGSWLLGLLALASVAVLVGGRMTGQARRVGLLKAVGGTPLLVTAVLLAEHVVLAVAAAAGGLALGWLVAPLLASPGAGLVGTPGAPSLTGPDAGLVVAVALAVAVLATAVTAFRASRASTVAALAGQPRFPRRRAWLIRASAVLPVPLLLGLRLAGRRPRRAVLTAASIAVTVTGLVAVLAAHALVGQQSAALHNPTFARVSRVMLVLTVVLVLLAAVTTLLVTWATVLDTRHAAALARSLGATPAQIAGGLSLAQVLAALPGALLGIPLGIALFAVANSSGQVAVPPAWRVAAAVLATLAAVAALTAVPALAGGRQPVAPVLQSETA